MCVCDDLVLGVLGILQLLTQICLALSALLLHADLYSKPFDKLMFALQSLQAHDDGNVVLLELLTVLPEEISDSRHVSHQSDLRQEVIPFIILFFFCLCCTYLAFGFVTVALAYFHGSRLLTPAV